MKSYGCGIVCPACGSADTAVKDTRPSGDMIRRRRSCPACHNRFTTFETATDDLEASHFYDAIKLNGELQALPKNVREALRHAIRYGAIEFDKLKGDG